MPLNVIKTFLAQKKVEFTNPILKFVSEKYGRYGFAVLIDRHVVVLNNDLEEVQTYPLSGSFEASLYQRESAIEQTLPILHFSRCVDYPLLLVQDSCYWAEGQESFFVSSYVLNSERYQVHLASEKEITFKKRDTNLSWLFYKKVTKTVPFIESAPVLSTHWLYSWELCIESPNLLHPSASIWTSAQHLVFIND